ncbi:laminin subunit gamma-2-like [Arapaima gigas]
MRTGFIFLCGYFSLIFLSPAQGIDRYKSSLSQCNGKSNVWTLDSKGLRCLNCKDNTDGRHCEDCRHGFYRQSPGDKCQPCNCNPAGSISLKCDSQGICSCKPNIQGTKCERCANGAPLTASGCTKTCSSGQLTGSEPDCLPCFCYGHSTSCSLAKGYTIHTISSSFSAGSDGWWAAGDHGFLPSNMKFYWSAKHQNLQVISQDSMPIYLYASASFLGNQILSYRQTLSFSLQLDRGHRQPSATDVILEGAGLRVAASLGDQKTVLPCGHKITYTIRLDEQPSSRWQPTLSTVQFHKLLQNLTAIKIRGTFGENSHGYLDDVQLMSARQGLGSPARWVENCSCPVGYEGQFCERCASGYMRADHAGGPFSPCKPCNCYGGSCDPQTGDCLSADESSGVHTCPLGFYRDLRQPQSCVRCPCPQGVSCSMNTWSAEVKCDRCPPGVTGQYCSICEDGFFGDPLGESGPQRPCQRCQCSRQVDPNAVGNCDHLTGKCLKCLNNTTGFFCEKCQDGFHRSHPTHSCKACNCNLMGSLSNKCSDSGQCSCKEGFEGLTCERSVCPACFDRVKTKVEIYSHKLQELESLLSGASSGSLPVNNAQMEKAIQISELLVADMQENANKLSEAEKELLVRLTDITQAQSVEARNLQAVAQTVDIVKKLKEQHQMQLSKIQLLIVEIRRLLDKARVDIKRAEIPLGDADEDVSSLSLLVNKATSLAVKHQGEAEMVEGETKNALADAEKALGLMRSAILGEKKIAELVNDLRTGYEGTASHVKSMEAMAGRLSSSANEEIQKAAEILQQLPAVELNTIDTVGPQMESIVGKLDVLKGQVKANLTDYDKFKAGIQRDQSQLLDLLAQGRAAQEKPKELLARANAADADASLRDITKNLDGVNDVYDRLKGFKREISTNKAEADNNIKKLPGISRTIDDAVSSNSQTLLILDTVDKDYKMVLDTVHKLDGVVLQMEDISSMVTETYDILKDSKEFKNDMKQLNTEAANMMEDLNSALADAKRQEREVAEASAQGAGSYQLAKTVKDSVKDTMTAISSLLDLFDQPGIVDEKKLSQLETSIADIRNIVNKELVPRMEVLEEMENRQRMGATILNVDIDNIQRDIQNLKEISGTIPEGCYNLPPIERP